MKEKKEMPILIHRDELHENKTRIELETARKSLQSILDVWNSLELIPCTADIYQLLLNPQKVYAEAVNKLAEPPTQLGRFQINREAYINTLEIPIPDSLYRAAKQAREVPFSAVGGVWSIDNNTVVMTEEADTYIYSQNVYASEPEKVQLAEDLNKVCELLNSLNLRLNGEILPPGAFTHGFCRGNFTVSQSRETGLNELSPDINLIKRVTR